jgi:hypothetical protein
MYLNSGIGASVFAGGGGSQMAPNAAPASPQGPRSAGQRAYGVVAGAQSGPKTAGYGLITAGTVSLALLIFIWWSLPR